MYICFREKNWKPSDYWKLGGGERKIIRAFLQLEAKERAEELEKIRGSNGSRK